MCCQSISIEIDIIHGASSLTYWQTSFKYWMRKIHKFTTTTTPTPFIHRYNVSILTRNKVPALINFNLPKVANWVHLAWDIYLQTKHKGQNTKCTNTTYANWVRHIYEPYAQSSPVNWNTIACKKLYQTPLRYVFLVREFIMRMLFLFVWKTIED